MTDDVQLNAPDKGTAGPNVADMLIERKPTPLKALRPFDGNGLYALFYRGPFAPYRRLVRFNDEADIPVPIYVGTAVAKARQTHSNRFTQSVNRALHRRLRQHAQTIQAAANLDLADFSCRYVVLDEAWIDLGKSLLIARYSPLWNLTVDGFGLGRSAKEFKPDLATRWDVLHPGRAWAGHCRTRAETAEQIVDEVMTSLAQQPGLVRRPAPAHTNASQAGGQRGAPRPDLPPH